jgi:NodT family efflux transporter outer membrane factor (OMF) lipoprotein
MTGERPNVLRLMGLGGCAVLILIGCTVGPNYHGAPTVVRSEGGFVRAAGDARVDEPVARWWTLFNDAELNRLMDAAVAANPSVALAHARLREARAALRAAHANELPNTGATAAYLRAHNLTSALEGGGQNGSSSDLNLYAVAFDATWEIDLFGANRRAAEAAAAASQGARASLADAMVSLTAEVAQAYVQLRDAQQRQALTEQNIAIEERLLELMRIRQNAGSATDLDVARLGNQLDSTRATLGPLRAAVTQQLDRLAILTAREPGALDAELSEPVAAPPPPATLIVGDPASLLRRRPDIAIAERKLAQQTAAVGQSVAAYFPKITLLGELGFTALTPSGLFNHNSLEYVAAPMLQWTPWDFGRTKAHVSQAQAERDEAEADYRRVVLAALEDAESSLAQFGEQRGTVEDLGRARASAERVYSLTEVRLRGGTASTIDVLDAEAKRLQADISYEQALSQLSQDFIALEKSLGLGWEPASG